MKGFFRNKLIWGASCFMAGALSVLLIQNILPNKNSLHFGLSKQNHLEDPFEELRKNFFRNDPFSILATEEDDPFFTFKHFNGKIGNKIFSSGGNAGKIQTREDGENVYLEIGIEGVKQKELEIKVEDGQVIISGKIESKNEDSPNTSVFSSSFHRSIPAPEGTDPNKMQIENFTDKIVLKFPKVG